MFYTSYHPLQLLTHNKKKILPSNQTQPHKRKPYKTVFIPPPRLIKNQWFFQQQLSDFPLVTFIASTYSLTGMFDSTKAINNNTTLFCLDTDIMPTPTFQYKNTTPPTWRYTLKTQYLYGLPQPQHPFTSNKQRDCIYLENTMQQQEENKINHTNQADFQSKYTKKKWGNPFY